jgi:4-amino-4-deoxy-L-arabinose transferase-like glycosyltransferase
VVVDSRALTSNPINPFHHCTGGRVGIISLNGLIGILSRRRLLIAVIGILLVALALRVVHIGWSYSNNGVDEGVMIERALMVSRGYSLYSELPCDQAPAAFVLGSLLSGDIVSLRLMTALISLSAVACCMLVSNRLAGGYAMVVTGALLAVDFTFVRESRLFSLDALSASFMALSIAAFIISQRRERVPWLALSGLLIGLAASMKLIGGLGLLGMLVFMAMECMAKRETRKASLVNATVVVLSSAIPMAILMIALGPSDMIQGMVFDQAHRDFDIYLKLSVLAFFGLCIAYALPIVYARRIWRMGPSHRLLLSVAVVVLLFMVFQPLTFLHHMAFASPVLGVLAGVVVASEIGRKNGAANQNSDRLEPNRARRRRACIVAVLVSILVSGGLSTYGLVAQDEPAQAVYGRMLSGMTASEDFVICGDPIIAAYADRKMPPEVVNTAERQYPELDLDRIQHAIVDYNVTVVVVCYYLNEIEGLTGLLADEGFTLYVPALVDADGGAVLDLFQGSIEPVSFYTR